MCRHELRSRFHRIFSCGFPAVKNALCVHRCSTHEDPFFSPLTGYVTPLPNPTTYATKIGAKGTGRLILRKIGLFRLHRSVGVSKIKTKRELSGRTYNMWSADFLPVCHLKKVILKPTTIKPHKLRKRKRTEQLFGQQSLFVGLRSDAMDGDAHAERVRQLSFRRFALMYTDARLLINQWRVFNLFRLPPKLALRSKATAGYR